MSFYRFSILSIAALVLSACTSQKLIVTQPADAQLSLANTYSWSSQPISAKGLVDDSAAVFDKALRKDVKKSMKAKGYVYQEVGGDIALDYRITVFAEAAAAIQATEAQATWGKNDSGTLEFNGWSEIDGASALNNTAVLVLTAYQGSSKTKLWEAYVRRIVKNQGILSRDLIEEGVKSAVSRLMGEFPAH